MIGETRMQAVKRKREEALTSHNACLEIFQQLKAGSEQDTWRLINLIRSGLDPAAALRAYDTSTCNSTSQEPWHVVANALLLTVAHSTASLQEVTSYAKLVLNSSESSFAITMNTICRFRHHIVRSPDLRRCMLEMKRSDHEQANVFRASAELTRNPQSWHGNDAEHGTDVPDNVYRGVPTPPQAVTALPWTSVVDSDEAVSHLISVFLAWVNPTWRFVEADLFLRGRP
jgi:hypothetical protein